MFGVTIPEVQSCTPLYKSRIIGFQVARQPDEVHVQKCSLGTSKPFCNFQTNCKSMVSEMWVDALRTISCGIRLFEMFSFRLHLVLPFIGNHQSQRLQWRRNFQIGMRNSCFMMNPVSISRCIIFVRNKYVGKPGQEKKEFSPSSKQSSNNLK